VVTVPLILLAIPSVVIGFMTIQPMLFGAFFDGSIFVNESSHKAMAELAKDFHGPLQLALHGVMSLPFWLALSGVVLSYYMYMVNPALPAAMLRTFQPLHRVLENKYYLDWFNENVLARGARGLGSLLWTVGDKVLIDGLIVNGSWRLVGWVSSLVRWFQSGFLYHYALVMILGIFLLMTYFVLLSK
jgi:NADH-quinone oxidoreductase subunit L